MRGVATGLKRLAFGRPYRTDRLGHTMLPKRLALPVFASDAISSVTYAPEAIFLMLSLAGVAAVGMAPWVALVVVFVLLVVVASYRQVLSAYPNGGGDYEVARKNLGPVFGQAVGAALLIDYVLTVALSVAAAMANIGSVLPFVAQHNTVFAALAIVFLAAVNLRGVRESGRTFAAPVYFFIASIAVMLVWGFVQWALLGRDLQAESSSYTLNPEAVQYSGVAIVFIVARAMASGSAALSGIEAVGHGVPLFRAPQALNAARTLTIIGVLTATLFLGLVALAEITGVTLAEHPEDLIGPAADYRQKTLIVQLADAVFADTPVLTGIIVAASSIILALAANTAFNGFPILASVLARDKYLPTQFSNRGDRLTYSNGILALALAATIVVVISQAEVTTLIQLYVVGVFTSFSIGQHGMVRHWTGELATEDVPHRRRRMLRARAINRVGFTLTVAVLVIVIITKFRAGAWIVIVAMIAAVLAMRFINAHYRRFVQRIRTSEERAVLPSRIHCIVLVANVSLPTMRTIAYARATRPDVLEAVTVAVDVPTTRRLIDSWEAKRPKVPLKVIESPYRDVIGPVIDYIRRVRSTNPRDVVALYIPEYVEEKWWEKTLHNQTAQRLKRALLHEPGVMITSVPWQTSAISTPPATTGTAHA